MKNPLSSFINIFGLSMAIGVCVFTYGFARWTFDTDQFHEQKDRIYLVTSVYDQEDGFPASGITPRPLAKVLAADISAIKNTCRIDYGRVILKHGDEVFHENIHLVDPEYLEFFTFPLKWGSPAALSNHNSIILSERMSEKYFGDENPVGETVIMMFNDQQRKTFEVAGVAQEFPTSRSFHFNFLINYDNIKLVAPDENSNDWGQSVAATLVEIDQPNELENTKKSMTKYLSLRNEKRDDLLISGFELEPLKTLHQKAHNIRSCFAFGSNSDEKAVLFLSVISVFIMALACFNYINIAIISASKRLKEIGIRKTIGASRRLVAVQFLIENLFVTCFALMIGLVLANYLFIPWFEGMFSFSMGFNIANVQLWSYLLGILLFTGISSGIYPALYISKFQVVGIFKGTIRFGRDNALTRILLGFQLILASLLIASGVMFTLNSSYMHNRSWGYEPLSLIYTRLSDPSAYQPLATLMSQNPEVKAVSGASGHLGRSHDDLIVDMPGRKLEVREMGVGAEYLAFTGLQLKTGRWFKAHHQEDKQAIIVNSSFVDSFSLNDPIGAVAKIDSVGYRVIGVVNDFHSYSFEENIEPTIFRLEDPERFNFMAIRVNPEKKLETYEALEKHWASLFPDVPFQGGYQEDTWGDYFREISIHGRFWRAVAVIAILLAGLGLYGLVSLNVAGRTKEFSVRKILGEDYWRMGIRIAKHYAWLFGLALCLGGGISYYFVDTIFTISYAYHIPMNGWGVVASIFALLVVLVLVVFVQLSMLKKRSVVKGLRTE